MSLMSLMSRLSLPPSATSCAGDPTRLLALRPEEARPEVNAAAAAAASGIDRLRVGDVVESNTDQRCVMCGGACVQRSRQMRSADEGESVFLHCLDPSCGHTQVFM